MHNPLSLEGERLMPKRAYRRLRDYIFTPFPPIAPRTKRWLDGELSNWHRDWPEFNIDAEEINAEPEPLLLDNYRA